jgi:predicted ATPase/class 3 adenylate cyclase
VRSCDHAEWTGSPGRVCFADPKRVMTEERVDTRPIAEAGSPTTPAPAPDETPTGPASGLPSGTVTLLFTDIEGSTRLLQRLGWGYATVIADHHRLLRDAFAAEGGIELDSAGDGLHVAFPSARSAIDATVAAQRALAGHRWPDDVRIAVRMGLHTGEPLRHESGYVGLDVHRAARICSAGHGGQILLSQTTRDLVAGDLPPEVALADLGEHQLRDLAAAQRLYQVVVDGLPSEFPPLRTIDQRPNNLPRRMTSFVGRERELSETKRILGTTALMTLTGAGGVGKTRLAIELATEVLGEYRDGAWIVELGSMADPSVLGNVLSAALAVQERSTGSQVVAVAEHLRSRQLLLVLDDCEHVLAAVADAADTILRAAPGVRIVATSREPLGITGEALYPVPSLSAPAAGRETVGDVLAQFDACRLFVERCVVAQPSFQVTEANIGTIARICRRLDGIPLALELAAARVRALPVEQIAARLDDRFQLLTGGNRNALPRHQTLRAAMDWSYDLLTEPERAVLRRLSVFSGGCTLEAAEAVCAGDPVESAAVLDLLTRLVDRSLVVAEMTGEESRFGLLETVREYALERLLGEDEPDRTRRRHRDWYLDLVEQARPAFFQGPEPGHWLERLDREHDNLRAALGWSEGADDEGATGLRLATDLWRFWEIRGYLQEGRDWLERFLRSSGGQVSIRRADALTGAGILALMQGDHPAALRFHEESLALQRELGDEGAVSYALNNLANAAIQQGHYAKARELYQETLEISERRGDRHGTGFTLSHLADAVALEGDYEEARGLFERSIAVFREHDDRWGEAIALGNFAQAAARQGDYATARVLNEEAVELSQAIGDARGVARAIGNLGDVAVAEGDFAAARSLYLECVRIRYTLGDLPGLATAIEKLAWAMVNEEPALAARLIGAAEGVRASTRATVAPAARAEHQRGLRGLAEQLGDDGLAAARGEGRSQGVEGVLSTLLPGPR